MSTIIDEFKVRVPFTIETGPGTSRDLSFELARYIETYSEHRKKLKRVRNKSVVITLVAGSIYAGLSEAQKEHLTLEDLVAAMDLKTAFEVMEKVLAYISEFLPAEDEEI
jgi:hypothetical protein